METSVLFADKGEMDYLNKRQLHLSPCVQLQLHNTHEYICLDTYIQPPEHWVDCSVIENTGPNLFQDFWLRLANKMILCVSLGSGGEDCHNIPQYSG